MLPSSHAFSPGPAMYIATAFLLYFLCARWLRWRNYLAIHQKFGGKFLNGSLTIQDAQEIVQVLRSPVRHYQNIRYSVYIQDPALYKANLNRGACVQTLCRHQYPDIYLDFPRARIPEFTRQRKPNTRFVEMQSIDRLR
ncbi:hypothetical protein BDN71DRAFT_1449816 [Pleurotus eryngii]|uniref:Uncharacterized protein n=1 Tax=Pleurotus eryngii TaxID=5323 RepID=A0A9P6DEX3_PLEER|nr:hypothetical protein BDN71DRAFT_1449816 [Pleurotus eryngii]